MNIVGRKEVSGFRDPSPSAILRYIGVPNYDGDCFVHHASKQDYTAWIEFKHGNIKLIDRTKDQIKTTKNYCTRVRMPYFVVVYYHMGAGGRLLNGDQYPTDHSDTDGIVSCIRYANYYVIPISLHAYSYLAAPKMMTQKEFATFFHKLADSTETDFSAFSDDRLAVQFPEIR